MARPKLSLSISGHCHMELWLRAQGKEGEPFLPGTLRTFEIGHAVEKLMFDEIEIIDPYDGPKKIGNWWSQLPTLADPVTGSVIEPCKIPTRDRQREVDVMGWKGHIDAIGDPVGQKSLLLDSKAVELYSFKRASEASLLTNPFSREYVIQQEMLMEGLRLQGEDIDTAGLVYFNKVQSQIIIRFLPYDPNLVAEGKERLLTATAYTEPKPDWDWDKGSKLPIRCGYCQFKQDCAETRGQPISETLFDNKGKPYWNVL